MAVPRVIIDTNVLVAASGSGRGASAKMLSLVGTGLFDIVLSVPLVVEYEDVLMRGVPEDSSGRRAREAILDYLFGVGKRQEIFFLWRPLLRNPGDDMVLELAVAGGCDAIVTYNVRDFGDVGSFRIEVMTPRGVSRADRSLQMSTLSLRLPNSLPREIRELAKREGISINQFITTAAAEKLSALMTEEYLEKRAKRASREKFEEALAQLPDVEPEAYDRL